MVDAVRQGSGRLLFVTGEAGIGKIAARRRASAAIRGAAGGAGRWLEGRCVSYGESLPYWPFRVLLSEWLRRDAGPEGGWRRRCGGAPAPRGRARRRADRAASPGSRLGRAADDAPDPPPQIIQERIRAAIAELLERLAAERPVALALDDLHWADASSLALVERLVELVERAPILVVLAARPEPGHPAWAVRERTLRRLPGRSREAALEALADDRGRELLAALVGPDTLPAELERRLLARAEGNPFYLEELVRSMADSGSLVRSGGGLELQPRDPGRGPGDGREADPDPNRPPP